MKITETILRLAGNRTPQEDDVAPVFDHILGRKEQINAQEARALIKVAIVWFSKSCLEAGYSQESIRPLVTKFRDAGRRSAPWKPTSSRVPGRPQDGSDGNRINRWMLPQVHKFYASEIDATLVEVKYFLQAMSMEGAPAPWLMDVSKIFFKWLVSHEVKGGSYKDPVQLTPICFRKVIAEPRIIQSGHLHPLDRGGKHIPENTFLMLSRSNQLQGNLTLDELLSLMSEIVTRHGRL
jgi:hypothetical protein